MHYGIKAALTAAALFAAAGAEAEVISESDNGFITRDEVVVGSNPTKTWLTLINPADWWSSQHTWSADAANLRLTPQAGGCFCEKIPEVDEPDRFTLEGSVEHMRVIQAYPESALRMVGALGPLQSEPVTGVLTIALSEVEVPGAFGTRKGTRIVWEYNVGGSMRYEVPVISKAVDGVMTLQLTGLGEKLGRIDLPEETASDEPQESEEPKAAAELDATSGEEAGDAETMDIEESIQEGVDPAEPKIETVDEAFDDFGDFGPDDEVVVKEDPAAEEPPILNQ